MKKKLMKHGNGKYLLIDSSLMKLTGITETVNIKVFGDKIVLSKVKEDENNATQN